MFGALKSSTYYSTVKYQKNQGTPYLPSKQLQKNDGATGVGKKAADYGADDFLVKPVKAEELVATVRERLGTIQHES